MGRACGKNVSEQKYRVRGKCKVHSRTGHEGPEGEYIYSCTLDLTSALDGGVGSQRHAPAALPPVKWSPMVQEVGWVPGAVWTDAENVFCTRIRSPELPARSESQYRLSPPGARIRRGLWLEKLKETSRLEQ